MDGDYQYDARKGVLMWTIDLIDSSNQSGTMEFVVPKAQADDFFPVDVTFSANRTLCKVCGQQTPVWICKPDAVQSQLAVDHACAQDAGRLCSAWVLTGSLAGAGKGDVRDLSTGRTGAEVCLQLNSHDRWL